jgi:hypothetical protein
VPCSDFPSRWPGFDPRSCEVCFSPTNFNPTTCSGLIHYHQGLIREGQKWPTHQVDSASSHSKNSNKKFWEELIAYFSLAQHGEHRSPESYVAHTDTQQDDIISLLIKIRGERIHRQTTRWSYKPHKLKKLWGDSHQIYRHWRIHRRTERWPHKPLSL